jgi:hypothetical protein
MTDMTQVTELRGSVLGKGYRLGQAVGDVRDHLYEARHDRIPGRFFIRLFPADSLLRPEAAARIQRAARVASLLRDVHVVQILDFSVSGELPAFVVMQRTDAEPLWLAMAQAGRLPLARGVAIVEAVSAALASSHRLGLIHGDLRPELVLLPGTGVPAAQVAGFGWGKEFRVASAVPQSPAYLAPEQLPGSTTPLDERVDQFALGAIAYELLGGKLPFPVESADRAELRAGAPPPPPLAEVVAGIPAAVDEVLRRALSIRPDERFPSVRELAAELTRAARPAGLGVAAGPSEILVGVEAVSLAGGGGDARRVPRAEIGAADALAAAVELAAAQEPLRATGEISAVAAEEAPEIELDGGDEDLAVGAPLVIPDEGKTQVTRSPFFEAGDAHGDGPESEAEAEADLDVDDIRYDDARAARPGAREPLPFVHSSRASRPAVRGWAAFASGADQDRRDGLDPHEEEGSLRWEAGDTTLGADPGDSYDDEEDSSAGSAAVSETTQPDGKPYPHARHRPNAWLTRIQRQPNWVVGTVAGGVFLVGLTVLLARGRATQATSMVTGPLALRGPEPRLEPKAAPIRIEPILMPSSATAAAPAPSCLLSLTEHAGAEIWLDERDTGKKTPVDALELACGVHELALRRPDGSVAVLDSVELRPGEAPVRR